LASKLSLATLSVVNELSNQVFSGLRRFGSFYQLVSPFALRKLRGDRYFCGAKGDTWTFNDPQYNTKFLTAQPQAALLDIFLFILSQWLAVLETG